MPVRLETRTLLSGSLTVPPLSQPLNWLVLSNPVTLNFEQLAQYEAIASASGFLPNARPVQPLDGRQVSQFNFDVNFQN
jgi:carbonic anhydrase